MPRPVAILLTIVLALFSFALLFGMIDVAGTVPGIVVVIGLIAYASLLFVL